MTKTGQEQKQIKKHPSLSLGTKSNKFDRKEDKITTKEKKNKKHVSENERYKREPTPILKIEKENRKSFEGAENSKQVENDVQKTQNKPANGEQIVDKNKMKIDRDNAQGSQKEAPKTKNDEKWSGVKISGAMSDFQMSPEVYNGVEANWKETVDTLSRIGVDVEEDKIQCPR